MAQSLTSTTLDAFFSSLPTGSLDKAIITNLRGINHRQTPSALPINRKMPGYTFFVRPQLNMQRDNLRNDRRMSQLLTNNPLSMPTYIRAVLDPRLQLGVSYSRANYPKEDCPIMDPKSAFIPFLTNNIISSSGWPSISVPTFTSKAGLFNESYSMVDGRVINDETADITCNFRNVRGDATLFLMYIWALYMSRVFDGTLVPYMDYITGNTIDYNTRIYRITTDYQKKHVMEVACARVAFPTGIDVGDSFNFSSDRVFSEANREIPITFKCTGFDIFDDIVIHEFNEVVKIFNPDMEDANRDSTMVKVPVGLLNRFNGRGYPRINMQTTELEWYVSAQEFNLVTQGILEGVEETNSEEFIGD